MLPGSDSRDGPAWIRVGGANRLYLCFVGEGGGSLLEAGEAAFTECSLVGGNLGISQGEISQIRLRLTRIGRTYIADQINRWRRVGAALENRGSFRGGARNTVVCEGGVADVLHLALWHVAKSAVVTRRSVLPFVALVHGNSRRSGV